MSDAKTIVEYLEDKSSRQKNIKKLVLFSIAFLYAMIIGMILMLGEDGYKNISLIALYAFGVLGGSSLIWLNKFYSSVDKSRGMMIEILEKGMEGRAITDRSDRTVYVNDKVSEITRGKRKPNFDEFIAEFANPLEVKEQLRKLKVEAEGSGSASAELHLTGDARDAWLQVTCQTIEDYDGYFHWRIDDITPRHKMESLIKEERAKLRDFTDNAPVGFFSVNADGVFTFANETLLEMLEANTADIVNKAKLHDFIESIPDGAKPYECLQSKSRQQSGEIFMKTLKGKVFRASVAHSINHDVSGGIITHSIVYDLTNEQNIKKALQVSEDRFKRLFEEAPIGICILDKDMRMKDINHALTVIMGKSESRINNSTIFEHVKDEYRKLVQDWISSIGKDAQSDALGIEITLDGEKHPVVQLFANKLQSEDSLVLHFIDLTERKNLEKQFSQSQKMQAVGQLAGGIAHDFNNLLTAMIGFADLLLLRHKPGDPSFSDINQIKQNANRASGMVKQLLAFSRQQTLKSRVLDLTDVFSELSHLLRRLIGVNIELNISHDNNDAIVKADQGQIEQVLINLAVNARDAMPNGGVITISTRRFLNQDDLKLQGEEVLPKGEWVEISVEDTGTGIAEDVMPRIFEPFFTTKPVGSGTGLGLATVHGIVHQTGGHIGVSSVLGKGTTFRIYLPAYKQEETVATETKPSEEVRKVTDLTGSASILLVEDEDAVRIFSARALSNKGYKVVDVSGGEAALKVLAEGNFKPEMLITDVMMPEMDGTTLAKKVAEKYPEMKIIFMSGYAEDKFKEHVGGNAYFLPKPFSLKQLAERVKEVIEDL